MIYPWKNPQWIYTWKNQVYPNQSISTLILRFQSSKLPKLLRKISVLRPSSQNQSLRLPYRFQFCSQSKVRTNLVRTTSTRMMNKQLRKMKTKGFWLIETVLATPTNQVNSPRSQLYPPISAGLMKTSSSVTSQSSRGTTLPMSQGSTLDSNQEVQRDSWIHKLYTTKSSRIVSMRIKTAIELTTNQE